MKEQSRWFFISNRLPFQLQKQKIVRSSGGLVTALLDINIEQPKYWMGATTDKNLLKISTKEIQKQLNFEGFLPVYIEPDLYKAYYDYFCNDVIWPLFHYESQRVKFRPGAWEAYVKVNLLFANEILKQAKDGDTIWIHDFHFFLLPQFLREKNKNLKIGFFLHIPFPSAEIFRQFAKREEVLRSLLNCDLIGFHDYSYLRHFCVSLMGLMGIESNLMYVQHHGRIINLGVFPVSINTPHLHELSHKPEIVRRTKTFQTNFKTQTILGLDRLDYSKGISLKLRAFKSLLKNYPHMVGRVSFLQVAIPTRAGVKEYMTLKQEIEQMVGEINGEFGSPDYVPVRYIYKSVSEEDLIALYKACNVLFVGSKRDGMNLVALEYIASQNLDNPGTVVLSEFTGASSILGEAFIVNPWDIENTATSLYNALMLPKSERIARQKIMFDFLHGYTNTDWAKSFMNELTEIHHIKQKTTSLYVNKDRILNLPMEFSEKIKKNTVCFFDYDGTLTAIKGHPNEVVLDENIKKLLLKVSKKNKVVIISGRDRKYLEKQFANTPFYLASEHGALFYSPKEKKWKSLLRSNVKEWRKIALRIMNDYAKRVPRSFLETKRASVVWHYRLSPERFANYQANKLAEELEVGLSNFPAKIVMGKKNIEVRAFEANKGEFINWFLTSQENLGLPIAIGDDRTDEDMFRVLETYGLTIKIGPESTLAKYRLEDQKDIGPFLENLLLH